MHELLLYLNSCLRFMLFFSAKITVMSRNFYVFPLYLTLKLFE